jgi:amino acid transporter
MKKSLGIFSLAMMTVVSVDSLRNLPAAALFGSTLFFFFLIAAVLFLLPSALISAELASSQPGRPGVYAWVTDAFGPAWGFAAVWFQWIENVIWYPTILAFVGGSVAYLISPTLIDSPYFLMGIVLIAFWGVTLINLMGMQTSAFFSNLCAVFGLMIPMLLIIGLGAYWVLSGQPLQIDFHAANLLPSLHSGHAWVALTGIILSFCGMEIATVHEAEVRSPQSAYPTAMALASGIIVVTLLCGALSIASVLPEKQISLVSGIMQAFHAFFMAYHLSWLLLPLSLMLVLGGLGGVSNWVIAPTKGLLMAAKAGQLPAHMAQENIYGAPSVLLIYQAVIASLITLAFLLLPSVNASYWLLTVLAAQLYMIMYVLLFAAAYRLRKRGAGHSGGFRIPGGQLGLGCVVLLGMVGATLTFFVGFFPPEVIKMGSIFHYESLLVGGLILFSLPPFLLYWCYGKRFSQATLK